MGLFKFLTRLHLTGPLGPAGYQLGGELGNKVEEWIEGDPIIEPTPPDPSLAITARKDATRKARDKRGFRSTILADDETESILG